MNIRALQSVSLVVLLILTGCSGFGIGESEEPLSVTPADVPLDRYGGSIAPGLTRNDIVNAQALVREHREILANKSVSVNQTIRIVAENGTELVQVNVTAHYASNSAKYRITRTIRRDTTERDTNAIYRMNKWISGETIYKRLHRDGNTTYESISIDEDDLMVKSRVRIMQKILQRVRQVSTEPLSEREDPTQYRVTSVEIRPLEWESEIINRTVVSEDLSFIISERGFIQEFRYDRTIRRNSTPTRTVLSIHYYNLGNTTVERPPWIDEAKNATTSRRTNTSVTSTEK